MPFNYHSLTLSDFYEMKIGLRPDGSATPLIKNNKGEWVGLPKYYGDPNKTDTEIREEAFSHYQELMELMNTIQPQKNELLKDVHRN